MIGLAARTGPLTQPLRYSTSTGKRKGPKIERKETLTGHTRINNNF